MLATQLKEALKATAQVQRASVQGMSEKLASVRALSRDFASAHSSVPSAMRGILGASVLLLLRFAVLTPTASAAVLQSNAGAVPQSSEVATPSPVFSEPLHPALQQVGYSVGQIRIDRWKLSKSWKAQLQSDADSIAQDLAHALPALFQQAQASPTALDAQLRVMQNVDALYDVLVRLTMAADLTGKKSDAALLDSSLDRLEAARKTASGQLLSAAALQNRQLIQLQARVEANPAHEGVSGAHPRTIVVDNEVRRGTRRRPAHHKKAAASTTGTKSGSGASQPAAGKPSPQN